MADDRANGPRVPARAACQTPTIRDAQDSDNSAAFNGSNQLGGEAIRLLTRAVHLLERIAQVSTQSATSSQMLTKSELAKRLGVSTRWVERHVSPSSQPVRRGRAWYSLELVMRQLGDLDLRRSTRGPKPTGSPANRHGARDAVARGVERDLRRSLRSGRA